MKRTMINEYGESVVTMDSADRGPLTAEEVEKIHQMDDIIDEYDEDCPPIPEAMIVQMQNDIRSRRARKAKNTETIIEIGSEAASVVG